MITDIFIRYVSASKFPSHEMRLTVCHRMCWKCCLISHVLSATFNFTEHLNQCCSDRDGVHFLHVSFVIIFHLNQTYLLDLLYTIIELCENRGSYVSFITKIAFWNLHCNVFIFIIIWLEMQIRLEIRCHIFLSKNVCRIEYSMHIYANGETPPFYSRF